MKLIFQIERNTLRMSSNNDCPICMDTIGLSNCLTTECGHRFHTSCLMRNVAHNGFGCPYCRSIMADEPHDDESEYTEGNTEDEDASIHPYYDYPRTYARRTNIHDNILRGFRFFQNNIEQIAHDPQDEEDEVRMNEELEDGEVEDENLEETGPPVEYVSEKLKNQGITYEQLLRIILNRDHVEYPETEEDDQMDDSVFGKIRIIISTHYQESQNEINNINNELNEMRKNDDLLNYPPRTHIEFETPPANVTIREKRSIH